MNAFTYTIIINNIIGVFEFILIHPETGCLMCCCGVIICIHLDISSVYYQVVLKITRILKYTGLHLVLTLSRITQRLSLNSLVFMQIG